MADNLTIDFQEYMTLIPAVSFAENLRDSRKVQPRGAMFYVIGSTDISEII